MCTTDNENVGLSPMLLATARCSQGSHPSLLPSMATLRTPSRRRAYHHADRPWIGGPTASTVFLKTTQTVSTLQCVTNCWNIHPEFPRDGHRNIYPTSISRRPRRHGFYRVESIKEAQKVECPLIHCPLFLACPLIPCSMKTENQV